MPDTIYMGDGQSCTCHIGCSWSCYGLGQLHDGRIHLLLKEACLGVLHSGLGHFDWFHSGVWPFSSVNDSESVLNVFRTQQLCFSPGIIITCIVAYPLPTLTGDSHHFKLGGGVLYHPSSGQICHAPGQDPSHSDDDVAQYMQHRLL